MNSKEEKWVYPNVKITKNGSKFQLSAHLRVHHSDGKYYLFELIEAEAGVDPDKFMLKFKAKAHLCLAAMVIKPQLSNSFLLDENQEDEKDRVVIH